MDIRQQALEAARPHALDIDDLLSKAAKIEAYLLGSTYLSPPSLGPITDTATNEPVVIDPKPFDHRFCAFPAETVEQPELDDDIREMLALSKALTESNPEFQLSEDVLAWGEEWNRRKDRETLQKQKMKIIADAVENCDIFSAPPPPVEYLAIERKMENYKKPVIGPNGDYIYREVEDTQFKMRDEQLEIGSMMEYESMVLNVCRLFGTTTMIAAFARQQRVKGYKVLILTNTHKNAMELDFLIDDGSVEVITFQYASEREHAGEFYDYIIVDNAAFIPYAQEEAIRSYIDKCIASKLLWERNYRPKDGLVKRGEDFVRIKTELGTRLILASVPGRKQGWFYEAYTGTEDITGQRLAVSWEKSVMTPEKAAELRKEVGEMIFRNQFENQFREND